jgi:hypothetical protein
LDEFGPSYRQTFLICEKVEKLERDYRKKDQLEYNFQCRSPIFEGREHDLRVFRAREMEK